MRVSYEKTGGTSVIIPMNLDFTIPPCFPEPIFSPVLFSPFLVLIPYTGHFA